MLVAVVQSTINENVSSLIQSNRHSTNELLAHPPLLGYVLLFLIRTTLHHLQGRSHSDGNENIKDHRVPHSVSDKILQRNGPYPPPHADIILTLFLDIYSAARFADILFISR